MDHRNHAEEDSKKPPPSAMLMGAIPRRSLPPLPRAEATIPPQDAPIPRRTSASKPSAAGSSSSLRIPRKSSFTAPTETPVPEEPPRKRRAVLPRSRARDVSSSSLSSSSVHVAPPKGFRLVSEDPFVLKIRLKGVPMRLSSRTPKRKRPTYQELEDTDSEEFWAESDDDEKPSSLKRISKKKAPATAEAEPQQPEDALFLEAPVVAAVDPTNVEPPPPGTLSTLWYSRECFLHVWVVEKLVGWKTRPVTKLDWTIGEEEPHVLDDAQSLSTKALSQQVFWSDPRKRMEVSRLHPKQCPVVLALAAARQAQTPTPKFKLEIKTEREEVVLVKWRGRSFYHCSWERPADIIKLDHGNNTARNKLKRFYQSQEVILGPKWKEVLEEERTTAATIHSHGESTAAVDQEDQEYFSSQNWEVERILACDENEMDLNVLARQRAINARAEYSVLRQREQDEQPTKPALVFPNHLIQGLDLTRTTKEEEEAAWDPEDNVRYVVKWKGLPFAEMTWEYWRDIKHDAVVEAEDFWYRQKAPDLDRVKRQPPHPHIREFRKLQESPEFGITLRERPMADLGDGIELPKEDEEEAKPAFKLRSYQLEGVNWLLFNWWNKRSCILADEMGLGKTIQSITFLQQLRDQPATQIRGPFLIVAPLSLIGQWQSEAKTWAPDLNVVLYHGSADARDFLVKQEFYYTDQFCPKATALKLRKLHVTKLDLLITTYEVVLKDIAVLSKIRWRTLIVDEAHRLKNPKSRLFADLATVPRDYCVLLTGTPLANATEELWALLHFADPSAFADQDDFLSKFGQLKDAKQVNELHQLLKPYLLRRVKEDVEKSLPPKEETILEVTLTPIQKTYYKAIYERNTSFLYKGSKPSNAPSLMNVMMELRKCCNHPYLVKGAEERILADAAASAKAKLHEGAESVEQSYFQLFGDQLVKSSGKMVLIDKLLPKLFMAGHKVLIFSQMVRVLDLLEELLKIRRYKYERLDGSTSSSSRAHAVDRFNRKSCQRFVMLLSTRAGGLGLNLTAADIVIIFDSDWNPQNDLQAMARAHRIGQTRAVQVYRLLTAKTYEMHMFHSASLKLGLERAVLSQQREQGDEEDTSKKPKSDREAQAKEIDELLKKGAYDVFNESKDDQEAEKFMETDIDQLLERSSKKVTYGETSTTSLGSGLGSFSKASFVASTEDGGKDVDLDDPDFWSKAIGLEAPVATPEDVAAMIDDGVKRNRKQVQVFDPYAPFAEAEQRKKDKIALKAKGEKEEKERQRRFKKEEKERKKREREERGALSERGSIGSVEDDEENKKSTKDSGGSKAKKPKRNDRKRALRRAENEDPIIERLKQAWEAPQRNRITAAALRFGFGRFCKLRNESNLTSLPIQDLEVFVRSYVYQITLQAAVSFMEKMYNESCSAVKKDIRPLVKQWLGSNCTIEMDWICSSLSSVVSLQMEVNSCRRLLRLSPILAEPTFVSELRHGAAFRALRRIGVLGRVDRIVGAALDTILSELGYEELGKRGCVGNDLPNLDTDLKSRFVTTEELMLQLALDLRQSNDRPDGPSPPAVWWDHCCDVALIVGTFVHGLGNYEAMRCDEELPFRTKIQRCAETYLSCYKAYRSFISAASAARKVFDDALESAKVKAQEEVQAVVAAAVASAPKREQDALALRKGGAAADAVLSNKPLDVTSHITASATKDDDSHYVTLPRLQESLLASIRSTGDVDAPDIFKSDQNDQKDGSQANSEPQNYLPMPDSRILNLRLVRLLNRMECDGDPEDEDQGMNGRSTSLWDCTEDVGTTREVYLRAVSTITGASMNSNAQEYGCVGLSSTQCGTAHRSLDDGSDFSVGAASAELVHVAHGTDAPRYLRAIGVPMNLTRYAICGIVNSSESTIRQFLSNEKLLSLGKGDSEVVASNDVSSARSDKDITEHGAGRSCLPLEAVSLEFRSSPKLRASVCVAVLYYGAPIPKSTIVDKGLWATLSAQTGSIGDVSPDCLFDICRFKGVVQSISRDIELPDQDMIREYLDKCLLPQCLRLVVEGNGPNTRNARGSKGEYGTAFGISLYPEHTKPSQSPLPDPCLPLSEHSLEAVACAAAILRRCRLVEAAACIANGKVSLDCLQDVLNSPLLRKSMDGLPLWWCPWIHDLALVVHVATRGVFAILQGRHGDGSEASRVFSNESIVQQMYSSFLAEDDVLPRPVVDRSGAEDVTGWIDMHSTEFPPPNVLERRLALVCAEATVNLGGGDRFDNLPMFDHGGWPRN